MYISIIVYGPTRGALFMAQAAVGYSGVLWGTLRLPAAELLLPPTGQPLRLLSFNTALLSPLLTR